MGVAPQALERLVDRWAQQNRTVTYLGADDLAQELRLRLWKRGARHDHMGHAWKAVRGHGIDTLRGVTPGFRSPEGPVRTYAAGLPHDDDGDGVKPSELGDAVAPSLYEPPPVHRRLYAALIELELAERHVILGRYFLEQPLAKLGADLGVTESRASQLHKAGLRHLRALIEDDPDEAPEPGYVRSIGA